MRKGAKKNPAAVAMGLLRAKSLTAARRKEISAVAIQARHDSLTAEERKAIAKKAVRARWARYRRDNGLPAKPGDKEFL